MRNGRLCSAKNAQNLSRPSFFQKIRCFLIGRTWITKKILRILTYIYLTLYIYIENIFSTIAQEIKYDIDHLINY